jgi:hypothetical protein
MYAETACPPSRGRISSPTHPRAARALRANPRSADNWNSFGWSLAEIGFLKEVAQAYRTALAIEPTQDRAANILGYCSPPRPARRRTFVNARPEASGGRARPAAFVAIGQTHAYSPNTLRDDNTPSASLM